jgi:hypothetical protein
MSENVTIYVYKTEAELHWLHRAFGRDIMALQLGDLRGHSARSIVVMPSIDTESREFDQFARGRLAVGNAGVIRLSPGW